MATNHTTNYALNLWEPQDDFLREEFNENAQKIDAALTAHDTALAKRGNCRIITGSYVGNGEYGKNHPTTITFPKQPIFVFVMSPSFFTCLIYGFELASSTSYHFYGQPLTLTWSGNKLTYYATDQYGQMNENGVTTRYIALIEA